MISPVDRKTRSLYVERATIWRRRSCLPCRVSAEPSKVLLRLPYRPDEAN